MGKPRLPDVEKQEMLDLPMLLLTLLLTALGLVMIYSSSFARALYESGDSAYYFKRQGIFALVGTAAMLAISRVRPELIRKMAFPVLGVSILFLILVFVPGIGRAENGATRWVSLGVPALRGGKAGGDPELCGDDYPVRGEHGDLPLGHCALRGDFGGDRGAAAIGAS